MKLIQDIFIAILIVFTFVNLVPMAYEVIGTYNYLLDYLIYVLIFRITFQYSFIDLRKDVTYLLLKIPYFYTVHDVEIEEVIEENE